MDWGRCKNCGRYGYLPHGCKLFECAMEPAEDMDWHKIYATDAEEAAEKYAEEYDCGGDYTIIKAGEGGETIVLVREPDSEALPVRFHVFGETVAQYHARELLPTPTASGSAVNV